MELKLSEIPQVFLEALCAHSAFLYMGFSPDDIYVCNVFCTNPESSLLPGATSTEESFAVILKTQGLEYAIVIGKSPIGEHEKLKSFWGGCVAAYNVDKGASFAAYLQSKIYTSFEVIQVGVLAKGFMLPKLAN